VHITVQFSILHYLAHSPSSAEALSGRAQCAYLGAGKCMS